MSPARKTIILVGALAQVEVAKCVLEESKKMVGLEI